MDWMGWMDVGFLGGFCPFGRFGRFRPGFWGCFWAAGDRIDLIDQADPVDDLGRLDQKTWGRGGLAGVWMTMVGVLVVFGVEMGCFLGGMAGNQRKMVVWDVFGGDWEGGEGF